MSPSISVHLLSLENKQPHLLLPKNKIETNNPTSYFFHFQRLSVTDPANSPSLLLNPDDSLSHVLPKIPMISSINLFSIFTPIQSKNKNKPPWKFGYSQKINRKIECHGRKVPHGSISVCVHPHGSMSACVHPHGSM